MLKDGTEFVYSKHAKDEWIRDEYGLIRFHPRKFYRSSCKRIERRDKDRFKISYRYCDKTDLMLIVDTRGLVITNYRDLNFGNVTNSKGTFYISNDKIKKGIPIGVHKANFRSNRRNLCRLSSKT